MLSDSCTIKAENKDHNRKTRGRAHAAQSQAALYGSTTVSETFGLGMTENVSMILSGYSCVQHVATPGVVLHGKLAMHP